jgi:hypothetical protein
MGNNDLVFEDLDIVKDINAGVTELLSEYSVDTVFKVLVHRVDGAVNNVDVLFPDGEDDFKLSFTDSLDFASSINSIVNEVCSSYGYEVEYVHLKVGMDMSVLASDFESDDDWEDFREDEEASDNKGKYRKYIGNWELDNLEDYDDIDEYGCGTEDDSDDNSSECK